MNVADPLKEQQAKLDHDPETTPKAAQQNTRTISRGQFLKSELHRGSSEADIGKHVLARLEQQEPSFIPPRSYNVDGSPKIPERRASKSKKNFILKAFGGRRSEESKLTSRIDSAQSQSSQDTQGSQGTQNTLLRRLSRRWSQSQSSYSTSDTVGSLENRNSFSGEKSQDITDISISSKISTSISPPYSPAISIATREKLVLCPQVTITSEADSVDGATYSWWVAVEITGALRKADGTRGEKVSTLPSRNGSSSVNGMALKSTSLTCF